jgi:hypothetical protein
MRSPSGHLTDPWDILLTPRKPARLLSACAADLMRYARSVDAPAFLYALAALPAPILAYLPWIRWRRQAC